MLFNGGHICLSTDNSLSIIQISNRTTVNGVMLMCKDLFVSILAECLFRVFLWVAVGESQQQRTLGAIQLLFMQSMFAGARSVTTFLIDVHRTGEKPTQNKDVDLDVISEHASGYTLSVVSLFDGGDQS